MDELKSKWQVIVFDKLILGIIILIITLSVQKVFDNSKFVDQLMIKNSLEKASVKSQIINKQLDRILISCDKLMTFIVNFEPTYKGDQLNNMRIIYELQSEFFQQKISTYSILRQSCSIDQLHLITIKIDRDYFLNSYQKLNKREWSKTQAELIKEVSDIQAKVIDCFQQSLFSISTDEVNQAKNNKN